MRSLISRLFRSKPKDQRGSRGRRGRRRPQSVLRRRLILSGVALLLGAGLAGGGLWVWYAELADDAARLYARAMQRVVVFAELSVKEVFVTGRTETSKADILKALAVVRGQPILQFDPVAARARLERLGWIKSAHVTRRLPNTIEVFVEERRPIALWQHKGNLALIDRDGAVVTRAELERFNALPIVVGADAPQRAARLLDTLTLQPELYDAVEAAVRIGGRRWNLKMKDGIEVNLPETDLAAAWAKLAELSTKYDIFGREVAVIDMRIPDRLVVRMTKEGVERRRAPGKST